MKLEISTPFLFVVLIPLSFLINIRVMTNKEPGDSKVEGIANWVQSLSPLGQSTPGPGRWWPKITVWLLSDAGSCHHAYVRCMGSLQYAGGPDKGSLSVKCFLFIISVHIKIDSDPISDAEQLEHILHQAHQVGNFHHDLTYFDNTL